MDLALSLLIISLKPVQRITGMSARIFVIFLVKSHPDMFGTVMDASLFEPRFVDAIHDGAEDMRGNIWGPIPDDERDYYLERRYPAFGNLTPRDIASRAARERIGDADVLLR